MSVYSKEYTFPLLLIVFASLLGRGRGVKKYGIKKGKECRYKRLK
jgi:hypothetical protein